VKKEFEYDVALSFAGEQRDFVRKVAKVLAEEYDLKVFFDEFEEGNLWGENLYDKLHEIYSKKAKYVIIFVSKEYKDKIWPNHERKAAQERALQLKNSSYILPVKFDDTEIPGLPSTIKYLDANKYSPYEIALKFIKKLGLKTRNRWFGKWEREIFSTAISGDLKIYKVTRDGFYFNISVVCGAYMGSLKNQYAKFLNTYQAISKIDECEKGRLRFTILNKNLYIQEENCQECHGARAYFDGKYILKKDSFYRFDRVNDIILSKLYEILGEKGYEEYEMCFSDCLEVKKDGKYLLFGSVPGLFPCYNGCLILDNEDVRGFFVNCNIEDNTIFWFATDNRKDKSINGWIKRNKQFQNFKVKKFDKNLLPEEDL